jgi:hypothetical protein
MIVSISVIAKLNSSVYLKWLRVLGNTKTLIFTVIFGLCGGMTKCERARRYWKIFYESWD